MHSRIKSKRIVLKFGTGILTHLQVPGLDTDQIGKLVQTVAELYHQGNECVLVSSGAVGAGMTALGLDERPQDIASIQACAAIGQSQLMRLYDSLFSQFDLKVAQILLTHQDIDSRERYQNAHNTLDRLLACGGVIPIINENDAVAIEELKFGDNDRLAAEVAILTGADMLILLTSTDGLLDKKRQTIPFVKSISEALQSVTPVVGRFSVGGMRSKLQSAEIAIAQGIEVVISNGRKPELISKIVAGESFGTRFAVKEK